MEYKEIIEKEIEVKPCIKCGSTDIEFYNCGYSSFNVAGAKCGTCKNEVKLNNFSPVAPDHEIVPHWNDGNDPDILIHNLKEQIVALEHEIFKIKQISKRQEP